MLRPNTRLFSALTASCLLLSSCGEGGSITGIDGSGAPISPTLAVSATGPINGFGSVIINGVHYDTSKAQFSINGEPGTEADLQVGSYIQLRGTLNADGTSGQATHISYRTSVNGTVDSLNAAEDTLRILEQTVVISDDTAFSFNISPRNLSGIKVGDALEVSGSADAQGRIQATRITRISTPSRHLTGRISQVDPTAGTFNLNGLTISYSSIINPPSLQDGQTISLFGLTPHNGQWQPSQLSLEEAPPSDTQTRVKTGAITAFTSASAFSLGNLQVITTPATQFLQGSPSQLALNSKVVVIGQMLNPQQVQADSIRLLQDANWRLKGTLQQVESLSRTGGRIQVDNTWIELTPRTRLDSEFSQGHDRMKFLSLHLGDTLEAAGIIVDGRYITTSLEREERAQTTDPVNLRGRVTAVDTTNKEITLQNRRIKLFDTTLYLQGQTPISQERFLQLAEGQWVDFQGWVRLGRLEASRVKLLATESRENKY